MSDRIACPTPDSLRLLAAGRLSAEEGETLLAHLETCPACATVVSGWHETDTLAELLREARQLAAAPPDGRVAELIARLSRARPEGPPARDEAPQPTADTAQLPAAAPVAAAAGFPFLAPSQRADELGRIGPYRVLEVIGTGGMGIVFRGEDPHLRRPVAIKVMLPVLAANETARARFLREAQACAAIRHDHIVAVYQVGDAGGVPYLAMELLEGEALDVRLHRERRLPVDDVVRIGREMATALVAAHRRGLIHRDIKPANVWLEAESGRVKLLDFGLARAFGEGTPLTHQGAIVGTPAYMAPEQAQGQPVDPRADLFSLGCVLYRMAAGQAPFVGTDLISTLVAVGTQHPAAPPKPRGHARVAASVALLLVGLGGLWASGVFQVKTKDGIIVLEGLAADATVRVDGEAVTIKPADGGEPIEVRVAPGERRLAITAGGFALTTRDVTLRAGERKPLRLRLAPLAPAGTPPPAAPLPGPRGTGWVPLFNGKDPDGWETYSGSTDGWRVADGQMVGRFSDRLLYYPGDEFADFHLRIEYKVTPNTMLHLVVRSGFTPHLPASCYRLNLGFDPTDLQQSGSVHRWIPLGVESHKPDEWVTTELTLRETRLATRINGKPLGERTHAWFRSGVLGLRVVTPSGSVAIRRLEVQRLPAAERAPVTDRGIDLFDGTGSAASAPTRAIPPGGRSRTAAWSAAASRRTCTPASATTATTPCGPRCR